MIFTDQMSRQIRLPQWPPRRIVSLVPSQTEFLADLGLQEEVLGITKFCIHPAEWFQEKKRVGGTKTLDLPKIEALSPDLIIANKEENDQGQIEALSQRYPVWMSDIKTLKDALQMMQLLGALTGKSEKAESICTEIRRAFSSLHPLQIPPPKIAYLIWRKPFMAVASGTYIDHMLHWAGFENVFAEMERYPEVSAAQLTQANPDAIFLSSEPYPFAEKHFQSLQEICPKSRVLLVDGEIFSWYGSRMLKAPEYFERLRQTLDLAQ